MIYRLTLLIILLVACKKDEPEKNWKPLQVECKEPKKKSNTPPYALPPRGNSQISCIKSYNNPKYWYCTNTEGKWACDEFGCEWREPLPVDHPFRDPVPAEEPFGGFNEERFPPDSTQL